MRLRQVRQTPEHSSPGERRTDIEAVGSLVGRATITLGSRSFLGYTTVQLEFDSDSQRSRTGILVHDDVLVALGKELVARFPQLLQEVE